MSELLPPDVRPKAFAAVELLLDLTYIGQTIVRADLESMLIFMCVAEATMRPLVLGKDVPPETLLLAEPPDELRGSISRLTIADRTGLARETVRRKTNALIRMGLLSEAGDSRVRTVRIMRDAAVQAAAREGFAAVQRYIIRMRQFGIDSPA